MVNSGNHNDFADDILFGASAIAEFVFGDARMRGRIYYLCAKNFLPHFRIGKRGISARKSTLREWVEQQEREGGHVH